MSESIDNITDSVASNITNLGFTIIEVLIVLAVAALILLIVLLAVPALQRNARNTNRKQDVGNIIAGVNENIDNNNGTLPSGVGGTNSLTWTNPGGTNSDTQISYFTKGAGTSNTAVGQVNLITTPGGTISALTTDYVQIDLGAICDPGTSGQATTTGASLHSFAVQYTIESTIGGALTPICQTS